MRTSDVPNNLVLLFLSALLFIQTINSMPPQELYLESSPSYAIVCFISFCIGAVLFGLVQRYCDQPSTTPPIPSQEATEKSEKKRQLLASLLSEQQKIFRQQQKISEDIENLKKQNEFITNNANHIASLLCKKPALLYVSSLMFSARMKMNQLAHKNNNQTTATQTDIWPTLKTLHWLRQYQIKKELETHKKDNQNNSLTN